MTGPRTAYEYITLEEPDGDHQITVTYGTDESQFEGLNNLFLRVYLEDYLEIVNDEIDFEVVFYSLNSDLSMPDQEYLLYSSALEIEIPNIEFTPALKDNSTTPEKGDEVLIDVKISYGSGTFVDFPAELGTLDTRSRILSIQSADTAFVGLWRI